jgi:hypothetical protein
MDLNIRCKNGTTSAACAHLRALVTQLKANILCSCVLTAYSQDDSYQIIHAHAALAPIATALSLSMLALSASPVKRCTISHR